MGPFIIAMAIFMFFLALLSTISSTPSTPTPPIIKSYKIRVKSTHIPKAKSTKSMKSTKSTKSTKPIKPIKNPMFDEAKKILVSFGYSATEAKEMLVGISGTNASELVTNAMKKVAL